MDRPQKRSGFQFRIRTILLATLVVAAFLGGRLSMMSSISQLENELNEANHRAGNKTYLLDKYLVIPPPDIFESRKIPDSIEQGMKASELEMREDYNGRY